MGPNPQWVSRIVVMAALGLALVGAPLAQTTTNVDVRNFEVISVDGDKLVVRDERGTNEYTVPADFRFTVDGKKMSVSELKAGMKGTATVTTTTTIKPVAVTEIRDGVVLSAGPGYMSLEPRQDAAGQLSGVAVITRVRRRAHPVVIDPLGRHRREVEQAIADEPLFERRGDLGECCAQGRYPGIIFVNDVNLCLRHLYCSRKGSKAHLANDKGCRHSRA